MKGTLCTARDFVYFNVVIFAPVRSPVQLLYKRKKTSAYSVSTSEGTLLSMADSAELVRSIRDGLGSLVWLDRVGGAGLN